MSNESSGALPGSPEDHNEKDNAGDDSRKLGPLAHARRFLERAKRHYTENKERYKPRRLARQFAHYLPLWILSLMFVVAWPVVWLVKGLWHGTLRAIAFVKYILRRPNHVIAIFTVLLFFVTARQLYYMGRAIQQTSETLTEMKEQRAEMSRQTWAAIGATAVSYGQLNAMAEQNVAFAEANKITKEQLVAMVEQNKAVLRQTELAEGQLKLAQEQIAGLRDEKRAWLGIESPRVEPFEADKPVRIKIARSNSGRTPAKITATRHRIFVGPPNTEVESIIKSFETAKARPISMIIAPSAGAFSSGELTFTSDFSVNQSQVDAFKDGTLLLYIVCEFHYTDITADAHFTRTCALYIPNEDRMQSRGDYDEMR
jgi:hypothetical protein